MLDTKRQYYCYRIGLNHHYVPCRGQTQRWSFFLLPLSLLHNRLLSSVERFPVRGELYVEWFYVRCSEDLWRHFLWLGSSAVWPEVWGANKGGMIFCTYRVFVDGFCVWIDGIGRRPFLFMQQTKVEILPVRLSGRGTNFLLKRAKRVEWFYVYVMRHIEILFCIQFLLISTFIQRLAWRKGRESIQSISMSGDISCLCAVKGGVFICNTAMPLHVLICLLERQVESFPDAGKFVVRNIMVQGGDYDLRIPS